VNLYVDTSALVKLYIDEEGSSTCRQAVVDAGLVATSVVAHIETRAALARRRRERALSPPRRIDGSSEAWIRIGGATCASKPVKP